MKRKGQSTIEFAMVLFAFFFFLSLSYNAVVAFATYQYLSYATFMTARSYQAGRDVPQSQMTAALKTMEIYVPGATSGSAALRFGARPLAQITAFATPTAGNSGYFVLDFQVPLVTLPLGPEIRAAFGSMSLETKSNLGREPTRQECLGFFEGFFGGLVNPSGGNATASGMEDNGC